MKTLGRNGVKGKETKGRGKEKVRRRKAAGRCWMSSGCHSENVIFVEVGKPTENIQQAVTKESTVEATGRNRKRL